MMDCHFKLKGGDGWIPGRYKGLVSGPISVFGRDVTEFELLGDNKHMCSPLGIRFEHAESATADSSEGMTEHLASTRLVLAALEAEKSSLEKRNRDLQISLHVETQRQFLLVGRVGVLEATLIAVGDTMRGLLETHRVLRSQTQASVEEAMHLACVADQQRLVVESALKKLQVRCSLSCWFTTATSKVIAHMKLVENDLAAFKNCLT